MRRRVRPAHRHEVTDSAQPKWSDAYADILQIGTRTMANFSLLKKIVR